MIKCVTIEERNAVPDAVLTTTDKDGWIVYQSGDTIPDALIQATAMPELQAE